MLPLSDVESEQYDVAVFHDVFLAFASYESGFLCGVEAALCNEIVK